jgi:hypothetical protein
MSSILISSQRTSVRIHLFMLVNTLSIYGQGPQFKSKIKLPKVGKSLVFAAIVLVYKTTALVFIKVLIKMHWPAFVRSTVFLDR